MAMLINGKYYCPACGRELGGPWENCHKGWFPMRLIGNYNDSSWAPAFRKDLIDIQPNTYDAAIESMSKQNIELAKRERKPAVVKDRKDVERIFNYGK